MAVPPPYQEAINVIDKAQKGSCLPAKKYSSEVVLALALNTQT